jgi:hypothetical protein
MAQVFARKCISMYEVEWRYVLNQYPQQWEPLLKRVFVYSYFKCLLYATSNVVLSEIPDDTQVIIGHGIMYEILRKRTFSFESNGLTVCYKFVCDDDDFESILKLAKEYTYIDNNLIEGSRFSLEDEYIERYLRRIAKEMTGTQGPHFTKMKGSDKIGRYLTQDNFPIANSFYKKGSNENRWRYSFNSPAKLQESGMLFGKAIFVTESSSDNSVYSYFDEINRSDDSSLVKWEVSAVAGSNYPNYTGGKSNIKEI